MRYFIRSIFGSEEETEGEEVRLRACPSRRFGLHVDNDRFSITDIGTGIIITYNYPSHEEAVMAAEETVGHDKENFLSCIEGAEKRLKKAR